MSQGVWIPYHRYDDAHKHLRCETQRHITAIPARAPVAIVAVHGPAVEKMFNREFLIWAVCQECLDLMKPELEEVAMTNETKRLILALESRLVEYQEGGPEKTGSLYERCVLAATLIFSPRVFISLYREAAIDTFREMLKEEAETL